MDAHLHPPHHHTHAHVRAQVLFEAAPVIWLQPKLLTDIQPAPGYSCPVYRTAGECPLGQKKGELRQQ